MGLDHEDSPSHREGRWEATLSHYPARVLSDIYPLTRQEYRSANLARRASYAYLVDTLQACETACEEAFIRIRMIIPDSMGETFVRAGKLGLFSASLAGDLAFLAGLRNQVVHRNERVNSRLVLYDHLLALIAAGYGAYETFMALDLLQIGVEAGVGCVVDREYIRVRLKARQKDPAMLAKGIARLEREQKAPTHIVDPKRLAAFLRLGGAG